MPLARCDPAAVLRFSTTGEARSGGDGEKDKNERKLAGGRGGAAAQSGRKRRRELDSELCNVSMQQTATSTPIFPLATGCQEGRGGAFTIHENTRSRLK